MVAMLLLCKTEQKCLIETEPLEQRRGEASRAEKKQTDGGVKKKKERKKEEEEVEVEECLMI